MVRQLDSLRSKNQIVIKFGNACNGECLYCSQGNLHYYDKQSPFVSIDLIDWLVFWSKLFPSNGTKENAGEIIFYGGEPLIYFDAIRHCVSLLIDRGINPVTNFWISTNGLLLDEDKVDFINYYDIEVGLSYDGRNTLKTRRKVITDSQEKLFLKVKRRNILSVVNAYDYDFLDNKLFLEKKFPDTPVLANLITANNDMPKELYDFNWARLEHSICKLISYYHYHPVDWSFNHLIWLYIKPRPDIDDFWKSGYSGCSSGATKLSVDPAGNFLFCNNSNIKLCSIYDNEDMIISSYKDAIASRLEVCRKCNYSSYCRCHCPLSDRVGDNYIFCDYFKKYIDLLLKYKSEFQEIVDKWCLYG